MVATVARPVKSVGVYVNTGRPDSTIRFVKRGSGLDNSTPVVAVEDGIFDEYLIDDIERTLSVRLREDLFQIDSSCEVVSVVVRPPEQKCASYL